MTGNELVRPFLKWAGGKRYLIPEIRRRWPQKFTGTYFEPFLGGGAVLLTFQPPKARVNDINSELMNCYEVVRSSVDALIACLQQHVRNHAEAYYYTVRQWDRDADFLSSHSHIERAARIIYLNKTCYNGLFRVNSQGQFNVPYGRYKEPNICDETVLHAVSRYFQEADIVFSHVEFDAALQEAGKGDFVYLDPPYDSETDPASFTGYDLLGFAQKDQHRLRNFVDVLNRRKCKVLLSNSSTELTRYLYAGYTIDFIDVPRTINSVAAKRGKVAEVLVRNYPLGPLPQGE